MNKYNANGADTNGGALYYLMTEAMTNSDGTNKPNNEMLDDALSDIQEIIRKYNLLINPYPQI